jgi:hypothetical protein
MTVEGVPMSAGAGSLRWLIGGRRGGAGTDEIAMESSKIITRNHNPIECDQQAHPRPNPTTKRVRLGIVHRTRLRDLSLCGDPPCPEGSEHPQRHQ